MSCECTSCLWFGNWILQWLWLYAQQPWSLPSCRKLWFVHLFNELIKWSVNITFLLFFLLIKIILSPQFQNVRGRWKHRGDTQVQDQGDGGWAGEVWGHVRGEQVRTWEPFFRKKVDTAACRVRYREEQKAAEEIDTEVLSLNRKIKLLEDNIKRNEDRSGPWHNLSNI